MENKNISLKAEEFQTLAKCMKYEVENTASQDKYEEVYLLLLQEMLRGYAKRILDNRDQYTVHFKPYEQKAMKLLLEKYDLLEQDAYFFQVQTKILNKLAA